MPIYVPGLDELMVRKLKDGRLSFTGDLREAPALTIVPALVGTKVRVVDRQGWREGEALLPGVGWMDDAYEAAQGADSVAILTEWNEFRAFDLSPKR